MSKSIFAGISQGAKELNIELPPEAEAAFEVYYDFLEKRGQHVNLTAISGAEEVVHLHFLDSIAVLKTTEFKNKKVIDIGSGAGFPGVPIKLAEPTVKLTLLDSTGKRITFLTELCKLLNIETMCINSRAEDAAKQLEMREQFDIVVSRAVARMNILCELCLPYIRIGGLFIAMKSIDTDTEIADAQNAIRLLGGNLQTNYDYKIPGTEIIHRAVLIHKTLSTPEKYPRRFARIQNAPL